MAAFAAPLIEEVQSPLIAPEAARPCSPGTKHDYNSLTDVTRWSGGNMDRAAVKRLLEDIDRGRLGIVVKSEKVQAGVPIPQSDKSIASNLFAASRNGLCASPRAKPPQAMAKGYPRCASNWARDNRCSMSCRIAPK